MAISVRVNSRNQITLPTAMRRQLHIKSGDSLLVELCGDHLLLMPEPDDYSRRLRQRVEKHQVLHVYVAWS